MGILRMAPPALDFTSTMAIGSTTPVACASMMISRRWTAAVWTVGAFASAFTLFGIALLYAVFHTAFIGHLDDMVERSPIPDLDRSTTSALTHALTAAEAVGLKPDQFDSNLRRYLSPARHASEYGYTAVFLTVSLLAALGAVVAAVLVRRPSGEPARRAVNTATVAASRSSLSIKRRASCSRTCF